jgi:rhodanese-related sulfurtransferase
MVIVLIQCSDKEIEEKKDNKVKNMTAREYMMLEENGELDKYNIIDVRTEMEYNEGHLQNSTLIPDMEIQSVEDAKLIDDSKPVIVYCRSGNRSFRVSNILNNAGFNVYNLEGGILALKREGYNGFIYD